MPIALISPLSPGSDRELAVLRVLGRFGTVLGTTLHDLVCPDIHEYSRRRILARLVEQKLIWQASVPHPNRDAQGRSRGRAPHVYGLTDDGKEALDMAQAEPHDGTYERLLARSRDAEGVPSQMMLSHESYASDYSAALLDAARRTPFLAGAHVQRRYAIIDKAGTTLQTIGAVIILAFDKTARTFDRRGWELPWLSLGATPAAWTYVRLALEIDTGIASFAHLTEMAQTYRQLSEADAYTPLFGGPLHPVIVALADRRARALSDLWAGAWPGSPCRIVTYAQMSCFLDPADPSFLFSALR